MTVWKPGLWGAYGRGISLGSASWKPLARAHTRAHERGRCLALGPLSIRLMRPCKPRPPSATCPASSKCEARRTLWELTGNCETGYEKTPRDLRGYRPGLLAGWIILSPRTTALFSVRQSPVSSWGADAASRCKRCASLHAHAAAAPSPYHLVPPGMRSIDMYKATCTDG